MAVMNNAAVLDTRKVMSGKDGALYDGDGHLLVTVESFQVQVSFTNQTYQPLGDMQEHGAPTSYKVTMTFSEVIVEDSDFFRAVLNGMRNHNIPYMNFRGMVRSPYDGSEEQIVYRDCVPDGTLDIQNMSVGELYKRTWNFIVNQPPELQSMLMN